MFLATFFNLSDLGRKDDKIGGGRALLVGGVGRGRKGRGEGVFKNDVRKNMNIAIRVEAKNGAFCTKRGFACRS